MADPSGGAGFLGLGKVVDWLAAGLTTAIGVALKVLDHRIKRIEAKADAALPREEFEIAHKESRDDRRDLYAKTESLRELVNTKVEGATARMEDKLDRLRGEFNGGLNSIRDEIRSLKE